MDEKPELPFNLLNRPLPHDEEAERAVLASILLDPREALSNCRKIMFSGSFYNPANQEIFQTLLELSEDSETIIDSIILANALSQRGTLERVGGYSYIAELSALLPSGANIARYVSIVYHHAILRKLIQHSAYVTDRCYDNPENINELLDSIEREVMELSECKLDQQSIFGMDSLLKGAYDYILHVLSREQDAVGIPTGYKDLDQLIMGLRPGEMIVLAARPSIGKTAFALNIASNIALSSGKESPGVGIFSLEMSKEMLAVRLLCGEARLGLGDLRGGSMLQQQLQNIELAAARLRDAPIFIDDTPALDILELRAKGRRMYQEHNVRCFVIDYLQLLKADTGNRNSSRENEVAKISGGIKALAKELNVPIIVLAQLNRQAEQGEKPKLSHLRESGAIEQDADVVMMLHRDRGYEADPKNEQLCIPAELIVAKHRNGPTGIVKLQFISKYTRFESSSGISDEDVPHV